LPGAGVVLDVTSELVPGGNVALPGGVVRLRVAGGFGVSALVTGEDGTVGSDADFLFYNQPQAPGVRLGADTLTVDPGRLRGGACRVTVVVSAAEPGTPLGRLPAARLEVTDGSGRTVARFAPPRPGQQTVLLLAELYSRPGSDGSCGRSGRGTRTGPPGSPGTSGCRSRTAAGRRRPPQRVFAATPPGPP
jgi:hypothetical protein